jgi:hypothetical protein
LINFVTPRVFLNFLELCAFGGLFLLIFIFQPYWAPLALQGSSQLVTWLKMQSRL